MLPVVLQPTKGDKGAKDFMKDVPVQAKAGGGRIVGPGTGTSDDVLLWGSNGEYMVRDAAVAHYGQDFLDRLNSMRLPRFADGGIVGLPPVSAPAGGVPTQAAMTPLHLHIGDREFQAMVSQDVADKLRREVKLEALAHGEGRG